MRQRTQSQKEPVGKTKTYIILYLAEFNSATYQDIRSHLTTTHNIRNNAVIRKHLEDLEKEDLLKKKTMGVGRRGYYYLEGFDNFKKIINYLKNHGKIEEFMKTKYFNDFVRQEDFLQKVMFNIYRENLLQFHEMNIKIKNTYDIPEGYLNLIDMLRKHGIDELYSSFTRFLIDVSKNDLNEDSIVRNDANKNYVFRLIDHLKVNEKEIVKVLISSPTAIDFILNPSYIDPRFISSLTGFLLNTQLDKGLFKNGSGEEIKNLYEDNEYPFLQILKSLYTADIISRKTINSEAHN
jgi:hypothetical protein